jgi:hypothetical protein
MNKYERAARALEDDPIEALAHLIVSLLRDGERRWVRLTHPTFTLEVRLDPSGTPTLVAPHHHPEEARLAALHALNHAVQTASDGRTSLLGLVQAYDARDWLGMPALRVLMRANTLPGGRALRRRPRTAGHLRLAGSDTESADALLVAP